MSDPRHPRTSTARSRSTQRESEPSPLGVRLRLVQAYYAIVLVIGLLYAAIINPEGDIGYVYDLSMLRAIIQMSTSVQALWLLQRRAAEAKNFCVAGTLVCIALSAIDGIAFDGSAPVFARLGSFATGALVAVEYVLACFVVGYMALSEHVGEVLRVRLDMSSEGVGNSWEVLRYRKRIRTWTFWRDTIIYFIVFSFLGHWAEILFCRLIVLGVFMGGYDPTNAMLWDQWLFPFSAEGTALAMVVLLLHPLKQRISRKFGGRMAPTLVVSFLANAAVCTLIDFSTGMVANQHYELWDYRDMPFNFMGQVCLQNSLVYSIAATVIVWRVYPAMDRALRRMPRAHAEMLFFGLVGFYLFEAALHFVAL